jgi:hypothetical protein
MGYIVCANYGKVYFVYLLPKDICALGNFVRGGKGACFAQHMHAK